MAQQTPRPNRDREPNGGGGAPEPNFNWRGLILFAAAIALIGGAFYMRSPMANARELPYPQFATFLEQERIAQEGLKLISEAGSPTDTIRGVLLAKKGDSPNAATSSPFRTAIHPQYNKDL